MVTKKEKLVFVLLRNKNLFDLFIKEFGKKIEGEENSKKAIFLSLCSIWDKSSEIPNNTLVSSESSAGKSFICKSIVKIFPKHLVEYRTKITPEAFTYWHNKEEDWTWDGKICYLEDISQSILDSSTFRVMCSEGTKSTIVVKQRAYDINIQGKPIMLLTTATTNPSSEVLNRFQIVSLDESSEQTRNILKRLSSEAEKGYKEIYDDIFTEALSKLSRLEVRIPFATKIWNYLVENYNFDSLRLRRDYSRLLALIRSSAVLHQFQREIDNDGVVTASEQDYEIARECINYIQTHTFKGLTHKLMKAWDCCKKMGEFTAGDIFSEYPFVNQRMWYHYLDDLSERGLLKSELRNVEGIKQRVRVYTLNTKESFSLPFFKELPETITNVTIVTNDTKVTNVTKDKNKCNNCNKCIKKEQNKGQDKLEVEYQKLGDTTLNDTKKGVEDG